MVNEKKTPEYDTLSTKKLCMQSFDYRAINQKKEDRMRKKNTKRSMNSKPLSVSKINEHRS